jgi:hypothetical protein
MKLVSTLGLVALTALVACAGDTGPAGAKGDTGPAGAAGAAGGTTDSVNGITPAKAFLGRKLTIEISGNNTKWDTLKASDISFGDGIKVTDVVNSSATALLVTVDIADTAKTGARDITVGGKVYKGFQVLAPAQITGSAGTLAQGSIAVGSVKNLDIENPFDTDFLDFKTLTGGVTAAVGTPKVFSTDFQILMDVNATAGARSLVLDNGDGTTYQTDVPLTIAARTPTIFNLTTPAEVSLGSKPLESQLFSVEVDPNSIVNVTVAAPAGSSASPAFALLPASGKWADQLGSFNETADLPNLDKVNKAKFFLVFLDTQGTTNVKFTPTVKKTVFSQFEVEPNDTQATANNLAVLPSDLLATMESAAAQDWFKVTIPAGPQKKISFKTVGVETKTVDGFFGPQQVTVDTAVQLYGSNGATIGAAVDAGYNETLTSANLAPGDYFVKVTFSAESTYDAALSHYRVQAALQ